MSLHLGAGSWFTFYCRKILIKTRAKFHVSLPNMFVNCIPSQSPVCDLWPRLIEEIMCHVLGTWQGRESPQHQKETRLSTWPCFRMMAGLWDGFMIYPKRPHAPRPWRYSHVLMAIRPMDSQSPWPSGADQNTLSDALGLYKILSPWQNPWWQFLND